MYKSMKHAGTKEIVPYKLYVPPLEAAYLEVYGNLIADLFINKSER